MFIYIRALLAPFKPAFSFIKKAVIVLTTFFVVLNLFFYFANKNKVQTQDTTQLEKQAVYKAFNNPEIQKTDEGRIQVGFSRVVFCSLVGEGCTLNPKDSDKHFAGSFLGNVSGIAFLPFTSPPASGIEWARSGLENAGFIPKSQAAIGIGLAAISPFQNLWTIFRNLSFLIMVIMMIVIGFMVMFRAKINAQTVISVENALPKIVMAMIFITFSYAIAGLMIDLMYISMALIINVFGANPDLAQNSEFHFDANSYINKVFFSDQFSLVSEIYQNNIPAVAGSFYDFIPKEVAGILEQVVSVLGLKYGLMLSGGLLSNVDAGGAFKGLSSVGKTALDAGTDINGFKLLPNFLKDLLSFVQGAGFTTRLVGNQGVGSTPAVGLVAGIVGLLGEMILSSILGPIILKSFIWLILMLTLLFVFFRIFFMFIGAYIQILLLIIFAPIILTAEMIPGKSAFMDWVKSLTLHLLTFPLFLVIMLVSKTIMATTAEPFRDTITGAVISKPLWAPPFFWGLDSTAFATIVGSAFIFMAPDLIKSFKEMTGIKPMQGMNLKMSSFFAGATGILGGTLGLAGQYQSIRTSLFGTVAGHTPILESLGIKTPKFLEGFAGVAKGNAHPSSTTPKTTGEV